MVAGSALALMMKATKIGRNLASDERSASVLGSCTVPVKRHRNYEPLRTGMCTEVDQQIVPSVYIQTTKVDAHAKVLTRLSAHEPRKHTPLNKTNQSSITQNRIKE